jgi:putative endonuclease
MTMAYSVYILQSEQDGRFYVGHTADLRERMQRHNDGRSLCTKAKGPWKLIYQEEFRSRNEACRREREIKAKKRREYIDHLVRASRL